MCVSSPKITYPFLKINIRFCEKSVNNVKHCGRIKCTICHFANDSSSLITTIKSSYEFCSWNGVVKVDVTCFNRWARLWSHFMFSSWCVDIHFDVSWAAVSSNLFLCRPSREFLASVLFWISKKNCKLCTSGMEIIKHPNSNNFTVNKVTLKLLCLKTDITCFVIIMMTEQTPISIN